MRCRRTAGRSGRWRCCGSSSTRWRCCSWVAGELVWVAGTTNLAIAIAGVILLNGLLAFVQEQQAEKAVEALGRYLHDRAPVLRDGHVWHVPATELVPGDVLV